MHGMTFHFGLQETILFDQWVVSDLSGVLGSVIGIIILGMIYEGLKNYREYLNVSKAIYKRKGETESRAKSIFSTIHVVQTMLQGVQLILGYLLMFIFMTYNVYLCIAVVVGSVLGYFVFSWKYARCDISECCS
ncbi:high affinity copper uptake protein 1-like [Trichogramma pretiosum]|uniref:high affinity copper uptake protein 1-like n=1 Tax=Trichogramma pretiosum TaxID=7493 RepID=UPI0006C9C35B|nr:high affinity copper uptake protein 1-like [Trichogramma pretiosum]